MRILKGVRKETTIKTVTLHDYSIQITTENYYKGSEHITKSLTYKYTNHVN